jgi:hypothetical protein
LVFEFEISNHLLSPVRESFSYGDVTIADEWLQNLGLCFPVMAFQQDGILIVPNLLQHGPWIISERPPLSEY